ncbi:MAG: methionine ABC transporter permease [Clostridia bacterium]
MADIAKLFVEFDIWLELGRTMFMTFIPVVFAYIVGLPLGIWCVVTDKNGIKPNKVVNQVLNIIINLGRSIPFVILLVMLVPFTRFVVGTSLGPVGALVPLTVACIPFVARMVEQSLKEIDQGVIDAAICMGATDFQIITKVYLVETIPSLIRGFAITTITLIGYTAMAGAVGARGLGYLAVNRGYENNNLPLMYLCVVMIIVLVEVIQLILEFVSKKIDKKKIN